MGKLIWHELSRYISLAASIFFWDFVGGILRDPGGIQPNPRIMTVDRIPFHRLIPIKIFLLILQAAIAALLYQERPSPHIPGTNAALWSLVAVALYGRSLASKEKMWVGQKQGAGHP
ncbi:hypothetical protein EDD16DRAFT_1630552 [Pisolithus croceorrhizus]|nr:hypothetical protein EDD16DRAFT_1630552 [Pisolithus croceorrhizus]